MGFSPGSSLPSHLLPPRLAEWDYEEVSLKSEISLLAASNCKLGFLIEEVGGSRDCNNALRDASSGLLERKTAHNRREQTANTCSGL